MTGCTEVGKTILEADKSLCLNQACILSFKKLTAAQTKSQPEFVPLADY